MIYTHATLPKPTATELAHSQKLVDHIVDVMAQNGGRISFAEYMQLALYAPGLGYYTAGGQKLGRQGDFVTAPELSALFARCLARQCAQVLDHVPRKHILEFGAGSGKMAADLLLALELLQCLPEQYFILEVSADLAARQRATLQARCPHLLTTVQWLDRLPMEPISGVIIANEVLDAMPVHRFRMVDSHIEESFIAYQAGVLCELFAASHNQKLITAVTTLGLMDGYTSEISLQLAAWLQAVHNMLSVGSVLLIDYGFPHHEYYHPDRNMGTLMCHYRQHAHSDFLIWPGLQDITAHVDFTAVAEHAVAAGLDVLGYTTQAAFLLNCGLLDYVDQQDPQQLLAAKQMIKILTLPSEMGELFKVVALGKALPCSLLGFAQYDRRGKL